MLWWVVPLVIVLWILPLVVDPYQAMQLTYGLIFAIAALGFNLLLGYTGLLSFGHSAYFGVGAYAVAFLVKYGKISSMEVFLVGASDDKMAFIAHGYYYYVLVVFFVAVAAMWVIVNSPFGKALQAIRDNETRAEFVGIQIWRYRWVAFLISGVFTGVAGALWVPLAGLTTPEIMHWTFSGKIVFMTVLGGFRTFTGPIIGGIVYNYLETYAVGVTVYWQMLLGTVLVVLVLALPNGIVGTVARVLGGLRRSRA